MTNEQVAQRWVRKLLNSRQGGLVKWKTSNMFCDDGDKIYSYGYHYPIAIRTNYYLDSKPVYFNNTESGYAYGRQSATDGHNRCVRREIEKSGGIMIKIHVDDFCSMGFNKNTLSGLLIVDVNENGEAILSKSNDYILITEDAMIKLKEPHQTVAEAKKSLFPTYFGENYERYKNYFFAPTGMDDREFAKSKGITLKNLRDWTSSAWVEEPKDVYAWKKVKARVFGGSQLARLFGVDTISPYVTGIIYSKERHHKTVLDTGGTWWKVLPMRCHDYVDKYGNSFMEER